jgi:hypothetical protein
MTGLRSIIEAVDLQKREVLAIFRVDA